MTRTIWHPHRCEGRNIFVNERGNVGKSSQETLCLLAVVLLSSDPQSHTGLKRDMMRRKGAC